MAYALELLQGNALRPGYLVPGNPVLAGIDN